MKGDSRKRGDLVRAGLIKCEKVIIINYYGERVSVEFEDKSTDFADGSAMYVLFLLSNTDWVV